MRTFIITIIFSAYYISSFACSCPQGIDGKFSGFAKMDSLFCNTFLVKVIEKDSIGIITSIETDYYNSTELTEISILNMDPSYTCSHSTDDFKIGEYYLIVLWKDKNLKPENTLSICYESFINVTNKTTTALITDQYKPKPTLWTLEQIENKLGLEIRKN